MKHTLPCGYHFNNHVEFTGKCNIHVATVFRKFINVVNFNIQRHINLALSQ